MAYENLMIGVTKYSKKIALGEVNSRGFMMKKRFVTEECVRATTEWFIANNHQSIKYHENNSTPTLFFCDDPEKIEQIECILNK